MVATYNVPGAAEVTRIALEALNHRGQDATGIAALTEPGRELDRFGGKGRVEQAYDQVEVARHVGRIAIGHDRYATNGGEGHDQPTRRRDEVRDNLALAHNGNLWRTDALEASLRADGVETEGRNDSEMVSDAFAVRLARGASTEEAAIDVYSLIADAGAFCITVIGPDGEIAVMRDPYGLRPLSLAKLGDGWVVASETVAFDAIEGAQYIRDVNPGELLMMGKDGLRPLQIAKPNPKICMTELVYVAHPDSVIYGRRVWDYRYAFGQQLAIEHPSSASLVVPVPRTAIPAAKGFADQSGIRYAEAITADPKAGRSFMGSNQRKRQQVSAGKLRLSDTVPMEDEDVLFVDDSIFRGNVNRRTKQLAVEGKARSVHVRVASAPIRHPNRLGVATDEDMELIASGRTEEEVRGLLGVDSLGYLSLEGMVIATGLPESYFSWSDFTGEYPNERHRAELLIPARS